MKNIFKYSDKLVVEILHDIGRKADGQGLKAYVVGGFVRDAVLKRPNFDIDIVVEGDAIKVAEGVAQAHNFPLKMHRRFGTATVGDWGGAHVDFVSARKETYTKPGVLPQVSKSNLQDDLYRRDFTINALAASINKQDFGKVIDYYDGLSDLKNGTIRIFHDDSFRDDPTRILRAVRFEQRFGFRFAFRTRKYLGMAIKEHFETTVSAPRYFQEFSRGLIEKQPAKYLNRLKRLAALDFLDVSSFPPQRLYNRLDAYFINQGTSVVSKKLFYIAAVYSGMTLEQVQVVSKKFQWVRSERKKIEQYLTGFYDWQKKCLERGAGLKAKDFLSDQPEEIKCFIQAMSSSKII